jgi:hypothetical protein
LIAMTTDETKPKRRNALIWAATAFASYGLVMLASIALLHRGGVGGMLQSGAATVAIVLTALVFASAIVGLGQRNIPFGPRTFRTFLVWTGVVLAIFGLRVGGLAAIAGLSPPRAHGGSAMVSQQVGVALIVLSVIGFAHIAAARARGSLLSAEQRETIRETKRALVYSLLGIASLGLMLVLLLIAIRVALAFAIRPLMDELSRTITRETGQLAFNMIFIIGGGWAILAHLGFLAAPTPLDWLTLLTLVMFAASFIAAGRRGLLQTN